ncbi:MAG: hypothetical protein PHC34_00720 [Candidatus Gastranaerophilales bacterium]|nr:hypothetical protein [Candidatus Gastranaerophilales bacterium]
MKIGLSSAQQQYSNNSVSFQAGEFNHKFEKYLKEAKTNGSDAQALLRCIHRDTITFTTEKLGQVQKALDETTVPSARHYLNRVVEIWSKLVK